LVISTIACSNGGGGGNGGGSPAKPADPAASKSVTTSFAALQNLQEKRTHRQGVLRNFMRSATSAGVDQSVNQKDVQALSDKLDQKVNTKDCVFKLPSEEAPTNPPAAQNGMKIDVHDMFFEISGDNCPMTASITVVANGDAQKVSAKFEMKMVVHSEELQKEMNIKDATFSGVINGATAQLPQGMHMNMKGVFAGNGTTVSHGPFTSTTDADVEMSMSMPQQIDMNPQQPDPNNMIGLTGISMDMKQVNAYVFGDARTDFSSHVKMDSQSQVEEYVINGRNVSAAEYAQYASEIKIPGMDNSNGSNSSQPPAVNSSCEILAFDAARMPESSIQKMMSAKFDTSPLKPLASAQVSSCGVMSENTSTVIGQATVLRLMFGDTANTAYIDVGGTKKALTLEPQFDEFATATVNGVSLVYACTHVTSCN
jgi:hypothetical protein